MLRNRLSAAGLLAAALAFGLACSLPGGEPAPPPKKAPIPDKAAQAKARKLIEEVYGEDYARARKDPTVLAGLARTLLQEARDTTADRLREDTRDPKANLVMGRFQAFTKGNWEKGLPLLARGSDPALKALAKVELASPEDAQGQLALAEGWWKAAGTESGVAKTQM